MPAPNVYKAGITLLITAMRYTSSAIVSRFASDAYALTIAVVVSIAFDAILMAVASAAFYDSRAFTAIRFSHAHALARQRGDQRI
jgi:hypothetical protein